MVILAHATGQPLAIYHSTAIYSTASQLVVWS